MKNSYVLFALLLAFTFGNAQQTKPLSLQEAVAIALANSDEAKLSDAKVITAESDLNVLKNLQYPDVTIGGQYYYLTNADVELQLASGSGDGEGSATPKVNQLLLGQANVSLPLFSGFKLKNTIKAGANQYEAAVMMAKNDKEAIALKTISAYINLYKANQTVVLIQENLKSAQRRVKDFSAMEQNGLLAKNDLLKSQLQASNIEVSLAEAKKNAYIINYQLITLLKLPEDTTITIDGEDFGIATTNTEATVNRYDIKALEFQKQAAENHIKVEKSKYYPSLSFVGGYIAADLENVVTIKNAMNIGVGLSYNLSDIFKAKSDVKAAKSKVEELNIQLDMANDQAKIAIENAKQNYELALKKFETYTLSEEQAIENYRIVKDKYDNGLVDTNDLLEADVQQLQSKINLTYAKADITKAYHELLQQQGQLTNTLN